MQDLFCQLVQLSRAKRKIPKSRSAITGCHTTSTSCIAKSRLHFVTSSSLSREEMLMPSLCQFALMHFRSYVCVIISLFVTVSYFKLHFGVIFIAENQLLLHNVFLLLPIK